MNYYIGLDVGGTNVKFSLVSQTGQLTQISQLPANSKGSKAEILGNLFNIIVLQANKIEKNSKLLGIGLAFPGPFDYNRGISLMQDDVDKYQSIYNVNVKNYLLDTINDHPSLKNILAPTFDIRFVNDAVAYALGEVAQKRIGAEKAICIGLGTGIGSCFLEDRQPLSDIYGIPSSGFLYDTPFRNSTIDDYVSARGIINHYNSLSENNVTNVKEIMELHEKNDLNAIKTAEYFGETIASALNIFLPTFDAQTIVIGGQISKSFELFRPSFDKHIIKKCNVIISPDTSKSAIIGTTQLF